MEIDISKLGVFIQEWKESVWDREKLKDIMMVVKTLIESTYLPWKRTATMYYSTNLDANSQIVFLDRFVVQWMVDLYVSPSETVVLPLLQIERVEFVRLRCGSRHQPIEHGRISLDARAENIEISN